MKNKIIQKLKKINIIIFFLLLLISCKKGAPDGSYCAEVSFKHQETNEMTKYKLLVEVKDQQLQHISFPNGHYDTSSIPVTLIPDNGKCTLVSSMGQMYQVDMKGNAEKCLNASNLVQCRGRVKDGVRCKRLTDKHNGLCWQHQGQVSYK